MVKNRQPKTLLGEAMLTLYVLGYLILSVLPVVKYSVSYVISGLYCLSFIVYYYFKENSHEKFLITLLLLILFGAIQGLIAYLNGNATSTEIINEPIRVLRFIIPCFIFYSVSNCSARTKIFLWIFITALFVYISITTLSGLSLDDMIARKLASGSQEESLMEYRMQNIGGFEFSYALGLMIPLFIMLIFNSKGILIKIFSIAFIVYVFYFVMTTQYMTLFIIVIGSLFLVMLLGNLKPQTKVLGVCVFVLLLLVVSTVLRWMASLDIGELLKSRLTNIADFLDGNINIENTTSRIDLYKNAFMAFLHNPITGQANSVAAYESHSLILNTVVSTGVLGLAFLIMEFVIYYKMNKSAIQSDKTDLKSFIIGYICYIILSFLNPIGYAYEIAIVIFLYVPLTTSLFFKEKTDKNCRINDSGRKL